MREVALCFSRDSSILRDADYLIHCPLYLKAQPQGGSSQHDDTDMSRKNADTEASIACPPNGIQPFLGLAKYIAPLCYLFTENVTVYTTMRALYCRIWCAMNVISSTPGTLYHVCQTFERLLVEGNIKLYSHLLNLKIEPLQV